GLLQYAVWTDANRRSTGAFVPGGFPIPPERDLPAGARWYDSAIPDERLGAVLQKDVSCREMHLAEASCHAFTWAARPLRHGARYASAVRIGSSKASTACYAGLAAKGGQLERRHHSAPFQGFTVLGDLASVGAAKKRITREAGDAAIREVEPPPSPAAGRIDGNLSVS
ncbi:MAG: hypothetical protein KC432_07710, partial [Thermomicrobiales bacterium]|nr:hypothetical protein [Thermomicrobiales bacterium]